MTILDVVIPEEIGDVEECVVVTWLKRAGDPIKQDETLLILQAEKVSYDLPSPASGQVTEILASQGEVVKKGQVIARLAGEAMAEAKPVVEAPAAPVSPPVRPIVASPIAKRLAREHNIDLSQAQGSGEGGRITEKDVLAFVEARQVKPPAAPAGEVRASPVARRLAREHNIDLGQVKGSGEAGRIMEKDVLALIEAKQAAPAAKAAPPAQTIAMAGMRAAIARRMYDSLHTMAQLTLQTEADVTGLVEMYQRLKQEAAITYTDLFVRACALALRQHPRLNARLDGEAIRLLSPINIGVAVALDDGLVVPVIVEADQQSLTKLAQIRRRLVERARAGQLTSEEMQNGTFTMTNLGAYEIDAFTPIINPPEAAILGIGRIVEKVVVHQGKIAQRAMMTLSLTIDHRIVDGAQGATFLQTLKQLLEAPEQLR